jgi:hypothetical protein
MIVLSMDAKGFFLHPFYIFGAEKAPVTPIPEFYVRDNPGLGPSQQGGPADVYELTHFRRPVICFTVDYGSHA